VPWPRRSIIQPPRCRWPPGGGPARGRGPSARLRARVPCHARDDRGPARLGRQIPGFDRARPSRAGKSGPGRQRGRRSSRRHPVRSEAHGRLRVKRSDDRGATRVYRANVPSARAGGDLRPGREAVQSKASARAASSHASVRAQVFRALVLREHRADRRRPPSSAAMTTLLAIHNSVDVKRATAGPEELASPAGAAVCRAAGVSTTENDRTTTWAVREVTRSWSPSGWVSAE